MMNLPLGANLALTGNRWTVAIRHSLAIAFMEVANIQYHLQSSAQTLSAAQMVTQTQNAIWRVECAS